MPSFESLRSSASPFETTRWLFATTRPRSIALVLVMMLLGCGSSERLIESDVEYEPPVERSIVVETVVDLPFDAAWSELIRRLSESSFQVSALEKASRFVRVDLDRSSDLAAASNHRMRSVACLRRPSSAILSCRLPTGRATSSCPALSLFLL